jgi:hypothetical protein
MPGVRSARSARLAARSAGAAAKPPLVQVAESERSQASLKIALSASRCRIWTRCIKRLGRVRDRIESAS